MKKLAIAIALLIMLAGGATGLLKVAEIGPFAPPEDVNLGGDVEKQAGIFGSKAAYIEMPALMIPMFEDNNLVGAIQIVYKLEVYGTDNKKSVAKLQTKINDAMIRDFTYYIPRTLKTNQTLDVALVKYRIMLVLNRVLGEGVVSDALIQAMNQVNAEG